MSLRFVERREPLDQVAAVEEVREGQLAAAEHPSQHAPAAARFVEMEHVRELVRDEQFDRVVGVEQLTLDRRVRERDDPVGRKRRRGPVEDVSLIDDDQADLAARRRSVRLRQQRMRRFGPRRGAPRVVVQPGLEGQDEVRRLERPVRRERHTELRARIGRDQETTTQERIAARATEDRTGPFNHTALVPLGPARAYSSRRSCFRMTMNAIRTATLLMVLAVTAPVMTQTTAADGWSGQVQCTIGVRGAGYQDDQVHTWTLSGAPAKRNDFRDYAATWTVTGSGNRTPAAGRGAAALAPEAWTRTVNQSDSTITIFVPVGTNTLRIAGGQRAAKATGGLRGTSASPSGDVDEWRFQNIDIPGGATQTTLSGSRPSPTRRDLVGWRQPSGASVTETCTWNLTKNSGQSPASATGASSAVQVPQSRGDDRGPDWRHHSAAANHRRPIERQRAINVACQSLDGRSDRRHDHGTGNTLRLRTPRDVLRARPTRRRADGNLYAASRRTWLRINAPRTILTDGGHRHNQRDHDLRLRLGRGDTNTMTQVSNYSASASPQPYKHGRNVHISNGWHVHGVGPGQHHRADHDCDRDTTSSGERPRGNRHLDAGAHELLPAHRAVADHGQVARPSFASSHRTQFNVSPQFRHTHRTRRSRR